MKLLSIIVPVYNIKEEYLRKCIKSILNQTFKDFELIIIDDGSTDNSSLICSEYLSIDNRIKIIKQENKGLSIARNRGIKEATGKWIGFVDDDDYLDVDYFQDLVKKSEENDVDYCSYNKIYRFKRNKNTKEVLIHSNNFCVPIRDINSIKNLSFDSGVVWNAIYKREIIIKRKIQFVNDRRVAYEDVIFNLDFFNNCNSVCIIDDVKYHYRYNEDSVSRGYNPQRMDNLEITIDYLKDKYKSYNMDNSEVRISGLFWSAFRKVLNSPIRYEKKGKKQILLDLNELLNRQSVKKYVRNNYENSKGISLDRLLQLLVLRQNKKILYFLLRIYNYFAHKKT